MKSKIRKWAANAPDWEVRAVKTFIQTFLGTVATSVTLYIANGFPDSISAFLVFLATVMASAFSSAACAAWNIIAEVWRNV